MKKINYCVLLIAALFTLCAFSACGDDKEESTTSWQQFFSVNITRCERVGSVLVLEFDIRNNSGKDIQKVNVNWSSLIDNLGNQYSMANDGLLGIKGNATPNYWNVDTSIGKDQTKKFVARLAGFDTSNTSSNVKVGMKLKSDEISGMTDNEEFFSQMIKDNRVMNNGIQTNDVLIDYKLNSCKVIDGTLYVSYTMTNNLGTNLRQISKKVYSPGVPRVDYCVPSDDLGNTYRQDLYAKLAIDGEDAKMDLEFDLDAGASKTFTYKLTNFDASGNAKHVSFGLYMSCPNYFFCDNYVHFVTLPIK